MWFDDFSEFNPSNINCLVKKLKDNAVLPKQGSKYAAGYDLYACIDNPITINPHCTEMIGTGLAFRPPINHFGAIFARSGLATKQGLRPANCVGVCDEDYTGEYIVAVHNDCDIKRTIKPGDRIAQLVFLPYKSVSFVEVSELSHTDRGDGGFGHTGEN